MVVFLPLFCDQSMRTFPTRRAFGIEEITSAGWSASSAQASLPANACEVLRYGPWTVWSGLIHQPQSARPRRSIPWHARVSWTKGTGAKMKFWKGLWRVLKSIGRVVSKVLDRLGTVLVIVFSGMNGGHGADPAARSLYMPPKDEYRP